MQRRHRRGSPVSFDDSSGGAYRTLASGDRLRFFLASGAAADRLDDIGALVGPSALLSGRRGVEREERGAIAFRGAMCSSVKLKVPGVYDTPRDEADTHYSPTGKRLFGWADTGTLPARWGSEGLRDDKSAKVGSQLLLDEEMASRRLIVFVERGLRRVIMVEAKKGLTGAGGAPWLSEDDWDEGEEEEKGKGAMIEEEEGQGKKLFGKTLLQAESTSTCAPVSAGLLRGSSRDLVHSVTSGRGPGSRLIVGARADDTAQLKRKKATVVGEEEQQERTCAVSCWESGRMEQQREVLLAEQWDRERVEHREMGHWSELQFLQSLDFAHMIVDATDTALEDIESRNNGDRSCGHRLKKRIDVFV